MEINEFNNDYINKLLNELSKEKTMFLLGDFNMDLLNCDIHRPTNEFLDSLSSHYSLPHILQPIKVNSSSKTLINNMVLPNIPSGNSTVTLSDHLLQFFIARNIFFNSSIFILKNM